MKSIRSMGIALVFSMVGCAGTDDPILSYEEFKAQAVHEADTGVWVVNGDEAFETEDQLAKVYWDYVDSAEQALYGIGRTEQPLAVYNISGTDIKWNSSAAVNITYCVSQSSFGNRYSSVVSALDSAAGAWEATARVNFIHVASADSNCTSRTSSVVFNVRQVQTSQYLARSFFPNSSRRGRELLVSTTSFGNISPWTLAGVMRHELGHTIGFRHEHTRPEAGVCFEDNNWRALTAYDSSSVMHYPQCNGTQRGDLVLTSLDKSGAKALYP